MSTVSSAAPGCGEYLTAIQHPALAFTLPELRRALIATDALGLPMVASGANAVVFKAHVDGKPEALRCYTNVGTSSRTRYERVAHHCATRGPACVAHTAWLDDAIKVNGETWPLLRMEWVAGRSLDRYVDFLIREGDQASLAALADAWMVVVRDLDRAEFAHGDLQHGNVLVDASGSLRLVDLDGVWVPELAGCERPNEIGHPNYQHPTRKVTKRWDRWVDTFSALVILVSLRALAAKPGLWSDLHDDEQLIFNATDFEAPGATAAWSEVMAAGDVETVRLARILQQACQPSWAERASLEDLLAACSPAPSWWPAKPSQPAPDQSGIPALPWSYTLPETPAEPLRPPPSIAAEARGDASVVSMTPVRTEARSWWPSRPAAALPELPQVVSKPPVDPTRKRREAAKRVWQCVVLTIIGFIGSLIYGAAVSRDPSANGFPLIVAPFVLLAGLIGLVVNAGLVIIWTRKSRR